MTQPKINLLRSNKKEGETRQPVSFLKLLFYPLIFIAVFFLVFSVEVILSGESVIDNLEKINIFQNIGFSLDNEKLLKGEADDRINILLLGMGGAGHPGPYLTDTIILTSLKPSENKISMISIPRDLSVPIPGYGWRKINNANSFGETDQNGNGAQFASEVVNKTFNQPIHYYVRVDFSGFEKLIDELGGIKINVENAFSDPQFPTDDFGYQTVSFRQGWQKMDGKTALNYARSRHGTNGENSDFARSKRQQKVLQAIKDKALSFSTFISYRKISALLDMYKDHVTTNLEPWEIYKFYKLAKKIDTSNINNVVLEVEPNGPLFATNINGAYLLLPKDMSFKQLQNIVKYVFDPQKQQKAVEIVKLEIQNGTKIEGLAYRTSVTLKADGYKITKIGNASKQDYSNTLIYDLTQGQKAEQLTELQTKLQAKLTDTKPDWMTSDNIEADFLIILGQDLKSISKLP
ncbi:MAG: LCP family protein [Candidatus Parcubacteria bacterium]|nr:LCP family protein [Candidatus Parcubacteria bacterium]